MACEYCRRDFGHHSQCPNYESPKSNYNCSECGENILIGEEYVENDIGDYAHWDCFEGTKHLLEWLGNKIRIMESD